MYIDVQNLKKTYTKHTGFFKYKILHGECLR